MRGLAVGLTILALLWGGFLASPYLAIRSLANAVAAGDAATVADRINIYAVRASLVKQLVAAGVEGREAERFVPGSVGLGGAGSAVAALGPLAADIVTPRSAADLVIAEADGASAGRDVARWGSARRLFVLVGGSRWRGFRNVYVGLPPGVSADRQVRVQFRLSRLRWRVVALDLPPPAVARLARTVATALDRR